MNPLLLLLLSAVSASAQVAVPSLTRIGAAAAVKGLVKAQAPGAAVGRVLESGKPVYLRDHVTTDAAGRMQVLLLDQTVFTLGPNSDMVLDEFVYDPATDAGKVTARVAKGVFRFVTGKVARKDPANMKIDLPVGTIGIRGTIGAAQVSDQGSTVILLGPGANNNANENPGAVAASNAGGTTLLTQPGFGTTMAPGQPPAGATDMSQLAQQLLGALGPVGGGSTGSGGGGGATGSGESPTQSSGQGTAAGGTLAGATGDILGYANTSDTTQQVASQTSATDAGGIVNGVSTWDQVRSAFAGQAGYYSGVGSYTCSGGSCGAGGSGYLSILVNVDFNARTYGGGSSDIALGGTTGNFISDSTSILQKSFGSSGNAAVTLSSSAGDITNSAFNGSTLSFQNRGGVAAQDVKVDLNYANSLSATASGSAVATFTTSPQ